MLFLESKKNPAKKYTCKNPKDSSVELALIKSHLDEYNTSGINMGRPLTINMHLAARQSPFSLNADMLNLRGIVVILVLLLISSSAEKIINVASKE